MSRTYNQIKDVIAGLEVFAANGGSSCGAEHDVFYAAQKDGRALTQADVRKLKKHGWFIMGELCSGCADDDWYRRRRRYSTLNQASRHLLTCTGWARFV